MKLVVLISGNGSNLQAIIDAVKSGRLDAEVIAVVSNRRAAYGLTRAENAGIDTVYVPFGPYAKSGRSRQDYDAELADKLAELQPDLIVLAGWMMILGPTFISRFQGRLINLHPALPGTFAGTHAIERAFEAYQRGEITQTGVMVHHVIPEIDAGPVIASEAVTIEQGDDLTALKARIHATEHRLLVNAIASLGTTLPPPSS